MTNKEALSTFLQLKDVEDNLLVLELGRQQIIPEMEFDNDYDSIERAAVYVLQGVVDIMISEGGLSFTRSEERLLSRLELLATKHSIPFDIGKEKATISAPKVW